MKELRTSLKKDNWNEVTSSHSACEAYSFLKGIFTVNVFRAAEPEKRPRTCLKTALPYINPEIIEAINKRDQSSKGYHRHRRKSKNLVTTSFLGAEYKTLRNKCSSLLKRAERKYNQSRNQEDIRHNTNSLKTLKKLNRDDFVTLPTNMLVNRGVESGIPLVLALNEGFTNSSNSAIYT